jgi:hypothetical protein
MAITAPFRGGIVVGNTLYGAWTGELYTVNESGERSLYGTLAGSDNIFIARNNAATPNVAIVCDAGAFELNLSAGTIISYSDGDVGSPTCVCGHLGYFIFGYGDGDMLASGLNATTINTLHSARTESNPDGVLNMISYNGQLFVFGDKTIEVWGEPTNPTGFPITRVGYAIFPGLKTAHAIAGWEPEFGHPPIYVGSDDTVRQLVGYNSEKISPPDLDRLIAAVTFPDSQIDALAYVVGGHAYWQLNGPDWSWVYTLNNQTWHERRTYSETKSLLTRSVPAFNKWLVGSSEGTDLYRMDHQLQQEAGLPIVCQMESVGEESWPNRVRVPRADFDFTVGVGEATGTDPIETDPTVMIEWSNDGGRTWVGPWNRKLGRQAVTQQRVTLLNTGMTGPNGRKWRWTVSDPVHVGFVGSSMEAEVRKN